MREPHSQGYAHRRTCEDRCRPMTCCFGATRVGPLLARLRLHLATDRFLARRRGDAVWEAACDYSAMVLAHMETQLAPDGLAESLPRLAQEVPPLSAASVPRERPRRTQGGAKRIVMRRRFAACRARPSGRAPVKPRDAFVICHEIYAVARELVDERLPTTQMQTSSKFLWRPDLHPRLVEYVADFARAGERALTPAPGRRGVQRPLRASRMILFRMHHLGGLEYERARRMLGISKLTWADWVDEIRDRVGRELMRAGMFPPGRYFREMSSQRERGSKTSRRADAF